MSFTRSLLISTALLLPNLADAKTYGGFPVGKTFVLRVVSKSTSSYTGSLGYEKNVKNNIPVPSGVADFVVGQTIIFVIGTAGSLSVPGTPYNQPFKGVNPPVNFYGGFPAIFGPTSWPFPSYTYAGLSVVSKNSLGKPVSVKVTFEKKSTDATVRNLTETIRYEFR